MYFPLPVVEITNPHTKHKPADTEQLGIAYSGDRVGLVLKREGFEFGVDHGVCVWEIKGEAAPRCRKEERNNKAHDAQAGWYQDVAKAVAQQRLNT